MVIETLVLIFHETMSLCKKKQSSYTKKTYFTWKNIEFDMASLLRGLFWEYFVFKNMGGATVSLYRIFINFGPICQLQKVSLLTHVSIEPCL